MMIKLSDSGKDRPQLQPGNNYIGQLMRLEFHPTAEETAQGVVPQFGPYLTFVFKIISPAEFATAYISGICSAKRHPKSKLVSWLRALGVDINQVGEQLDEAMLVNKQVRLRVELGANQRMKINAMGPVDGPAPVAVSTTLGFKPAVRPTPGTGIVGVPTQQPAFNPQPFGQGSPSAPAFTQNDFDDVPF